MDGLQWKFLPSSVACVLDQVAVKKTYKKGSFLYRMDDQPKGLFFIFRGLVGLFNTSSQGKEHLFRIFGAGQCLGHRTLMAGERHHAGAKVLENSEVGFVEAQVTHRLLRENHDFAKTMLKKMAIELRRAELRLAASAEKQVAERVAESMIYLIDTYPDHTWTRNEIAYFCGSTGPTVIRTLADFEKRGLIRQTGRDISIVDKAGLMLLAKIDDSFESTET